MSIKIFRKHLASTIKTTLSLVGMQLPEKYKDKFDVPSEVEGNFPTRRAFARNVEVRLVYFSGSCIPTNESFVIIGTTHTGTDCSAQ